jgi:prepilin-type N-terminal cleavage/methylation domain-containing protein
MIRESLAYHGHMPKNRGFTLVELMVSLTVFSVVMLISTGVLLVMIDVNAKGQALYSSYSNLTFALDSMTREIRTGRNYYCGSSWPVDDDATRDCVGESLIVIGAGSWFPITAAEVVVNALDLDVEGTEDSDTEQPYVDVRVAGAIYNGLTEPTDFEISTRVIQRVLDR